MKRLLLSALLLGMVAPALADTNLVMSCAATVAEGAKLTASPVPCSSLSWVKPDVNSMVASCTAANCGTWAGVDSAWRKFGTLADTARVVYCTKDIPVGVPFTPGAAASDPCPVANKPTPWLAKPQVTTSTGAPPPPSFSVPVNLSWTPPTTYVDGTALTDLRGFGVFQSTTVGQLTDSMDVRSVLAAKVADVGPAITKYTTTVTPGQWFFGVTAYACVSLTCATDRRDSLLSVVLSKTVAAPTPPTGTMQCVPSDNIGTVNVSCTWSTSNATACTASGAWAGVRVVSGSNEVQAPITASASYVLACTGPGGMLSMKSDIVVSPRPSAVTNFHLE